MATDRSSSRPQAAAADTPSARRASERVGRGGHKTRSAAPGPSPHDTHLRLRRQLVDAVGELIRRRGLRQREAAKLFGVTQPRVSDAVRGKVALFTVDTLVDMLAAAGITVEIEMHERPEPGYRERDRTAGNLVRGRRHSGE